MLASRRPFGRSPETASRNAHVRFPRTRQAKHPMPAVTVFGWDRRIRAGFVTRRLNRSGRGDLDICGMSRGVDIHIGMCDRAALFLDSPVAGITLSGFCERKVRIGHLGPAEHPWSTHSCHRRESRF